MRNLLLLILTTLMISNTYGLNLATRVHSLTCQGEQTLQSGQSVWIENGYYSNISLNGGHEFSLRELYFNDRGGMTAEMIGESGWNFISLNVEEDLIGEFRLEADFGMVTSDHFILSENGVERDRVSCRIVWKRWR